MQEAASAEADGKVSFRPLRPDDRTALQLLHQRLFPIDYDESFYHAAVNGLDGVVSWAALAPLPSLACLPIDADSLAPQLQRFSLKQQPQQQQQQLHSLRVGCGSEPAEVLAGFITARGFSALFADPHDRRLLGLAGEERDRERLLYVLTLGVAEAYQRQGIARLLLDRVLAHAAQAGCHAVYLHVASFNQAAIAFYRRAGFRQLAHLPGFYTIKTGRQPQPSQSRYDACLFACRIVPPPSPWDAAALALSPLTAVIGSLNGCLWGSRRRPAGSADAAAAEDSQHGVDPEAQHDAQQQQQQQQQGRRGPTFRREAPGVRSYSQLQQTPLLQRTSSSGSNPPEWLRSLFARK